MKKLIFFFGAVVLMFGFTQCKSVKFDKKPPFSVKTISFNNWVGGQPGVSGTKVEIYLTNKVNIDFGSLFFRNLETRLEINEKNDKTFLTAFFDTSTRKDMILDSDSKKEIVNKLDENFLLKKNFPFKLKENEAVISFIEGDKTKYVKIENIKETKPDLYPQIKNQ